MDRLRLDQSGGRRAAELRRQGDVSGGAECWRMLARRLASAWLVAGAAAGAAPRVALAAGADTVWVDTANPNCRSSATGTASDPYCTISRAITAHHAPGTVIFVLPGTYREQVTFPASGLPGQPIT